MTHKYLVVKASGGGGLGDSIKSVLVGALYASLSDRILVVDWFGGLYGNGEINPFYSLFEITNLKSQAQLPDSADVFPGAWRGRLDKSLHEVYTEDGWEHWDRARTIGTYSFDLSKLDHASDVLLMWEFDQISKLSTLITEPVSNAIDAYRYSATQFLRFSPEFRKQLAPYAEAFGKPVVGVHIRATNEFTEDKGSPALEHYIAAIDKTIEPGHSLFLATDNAEVQSTIKHRYQNVITTPKWFANPGEALHLNTDCPDHFKNMVDAMLDIVLLSKCSKLVITPNSSFSEVARIFSDPSVEIVRPVVKRSFARKIVSFLARIVRA